MSRNGPQLRSASRHLQGERAPKGVHAAELQLTCAPPVPYTIFLIRVRLTAWSNPKEEPAATGAPDALKGNRGRLGPPLMPLRETEDGHRTVQLHDSELREVRHELQLAAKEKLAQGHACMP